MTHFPSTANDVPFVTANVMSNVGGEGKTTVAIALEAAWDLLGRPSHLVDVDPGNGSLSLQRKQAKTLDWGKPAEDAEQVFSRLQDRCTVFDFGANTLASGAPIVRLHGKVCDLLATAGHRLVALVPISTNKPGAVGAARGILRAYSYMECHAVLVNRDGNGMYDEDVSDFVLTLPHLSPALQKIRSDFGQHGLSLADVLRSPPSGWFHAVDYLAGWLRAFATQPVIVDILGGDIGPVLDELGRRPRAEIHLGRVMAQDLHDDAVEESVQFSAFGQDVQKGGIWRVLYRHGLTPAGLRAAANELEQRVRR